MGSRMPGILPMGCDLGFIIPFSLCPPQTAPLDFVLLFNIYRLAVAQIRAV